MHFTTSVLIVCLLIGAQVCASEGIPVGKGQYDFSNPVDPDRPLRIFSYRPRQHGSEDPVLIVLHGMRRNADEYRDAWIDSAKRYNVLVLCPEFSDALYPGSMRYNLGGQYGTVLISLPEIRDMEKLVKKLRTPLDKMDSGLRRLYDNLPDSLRGRFRHAVVDSVLAKEYGSDILEGLNRIVQDRDFYDPEVHKRPTMAARKILRRHTDLGRAPEGVVWELNRALINQALGSLIQRASRKPVPKKKWLYAVIESIFDDARKRADLKAETYYLFGHSAGAQLAHRHVMQTAPKRAGMVVAANAGRYMWPDASIDYPYGLRHSGIDEKDLAAAFGVRMLVLVGGADIDPDDPNLNRSPTAMRQGAHRLERARRFYKAAQDTAGSAPFLWQFQEVPDVGHDYKAMAPHAAAAMFKSEGTE